MPCLAAPASAPLAWCAPPAPAPAPIAAPVPGCGARPPAPSAGAAGPRWRRRWLRRMPSSKACSRRVGAGLEGRCVWALGVQGKAACWSSVHALAFTRPPAHPPVAALSHSTAELAARRAEAASPATARRLDQLERSDRCAVRLLAGCWASGKVGGVWGLRARNKLPRHTQLQPAGSPLAPSSSPQPPYPRRYRPKSWSGACATWRRRWPAWAAAQPRVGPRLPTRGPRCRRWSGVWTRWVGWLGWAESHRCPPPAGSGAPHTLGTATAPAPPAQIPEPKATHHPPPSSCHPPPAVF